MPSNINLFDQILKIIARNHADLFARLAFPNQPVRIVGTIENVELILPTRSVDFIHRMLYEGEEYLLHIEFQFKHETNFPRRLHSYNGALTEQFNLPVISLVLYLHPRLSDLPTAYEVCLGEAVINSFNYPVLKLWDYTDEIYNGHYRELAPLLITLVGTPDEHVLKKERELILLEEDAAKRADLLALAMAVAGRYFDQSHLKIFFREELDQMVETNFMQELINEQAELKAQGMSQEILQQGLKQGLKQGLEQGLEQGRQIQRASILDALIIRFDPSVSRYRKIETQLQAITELSQLRELMQAVLKASDIDGFEQTLANSI